MLTGGGVKKNHIIIDQNLSDPNEIISGDINSEAVQWIRSNSHRYATIYSGNTMYICQLDDSNSNLFASDGASSSDTLMTYDIMMKLPRFYYHAEEINPDVWDIGFGIQPESDDWMEWDGKEMIGVYEGNVNNNMLFSFSGVTPMSGLSWDSAVRNVNAKNNFHNSEGYSFIKWKHHSLMAFLFYAMYGTTNSQAICGAGTINYPKVTGRSNSMGMTDTIAGVNGDNGSINFWGLENWWGDLEEHIYNVNTEGERFIITEDDGTSRVFNQQDGYLVISKMEIGSYLDLLPTGLSEEDDCEMNFCDRVDIYGAMKTVATRSGYDNNEEDGISFLRTQFTDTTTRNFLGVRLAYSGNYTELAHAEWLAHGFS